MTIEARRDGRASSVPKFRNRRDTHTRERRGAQKKGFNAVEKRREKGVFREKAREREQTARGTREERERLRERETGRTLGNHSRTYAGINLVSCRHALLERLHVTGGSDDAIALKSDYSLGATIPSYDIVVRDSLVSSSKCNARRPRVVPLSRKARVACGDPQHTAPRQHTQTRQALGIGSETVGSISGVRFENIVVAGAGKAGIGVVSVDGAHISDLRFLNISMRDVESAFFFYIGARLH